MTNTNSTSAYANVDLDSTITIDDCKQDWALETYATKDTLDTVSFYNELSGWSGAVCGTPSFDFAMYSDSGNSDFQQPYSLKYMTITGNSRTGDYDFKA